jgi:cytochrome c-type biogenesis protein CcmH/NrfG
MPTQAIAHLESSVQKSPNDASHHFHLGLAYVETGDFAKARDSLKKALALNPSFAQLPEAQKALATIGA